MKIPKSISVGNVAVRFIFTSYDHLSEKCRLFHPRPKKTPDVVVEQEPAVETPNQPVSFNIYHTVMNHTKSANIERNRILNKIRDFKVLFTDATFCLVIDILEYVFY